MPLVVQKFGGTSVSTDERRQMVLNKIIQAKEAGNDVVAVVSAMGRKGDPYATDTLLDLLKAVSSKPSDRTKDMIASCGEIISACMVAQALESRGFPAVPMTGFQAGVETNDDFTNGLVQSVEIGGLRQRLDQGMIVVVAGFQGWNQQKEMVTLGRGGSDTTAIALGGALAADEVEIFTDVPGIAYTDPRIIPSAPFLTSIDFEPMYILSRTGARIVHYRAIETAIKFNRPFWVRSTFAQGGGTLIGQKGEAPGGLYGMALLKDMVLAVRQQDPEAELQPLADNQWFYRQHPQRASVIVSPQKLNLLPTDCQIKYVSVITLQWDPEAGITPETVATALDHHGITREAYFVVPGGGAWAVEESRSKEAMLALYRAPWKKKTLV